MIIAFVVCKITKPEHLPVFAHHHILFCSLLGWNPTRFLTRAEQVSASFEPFVMSWDFVERPPPRFANFAEGFKFKLGYHIVAVLHFSLCSGLLAEIVIKMWPPGCQNMGTMSNFYKRRCISRRTGGNQLEGTPILRRLFARGNGRGIETMRKEKKLLPCVQFRLRHSWQSERCDKITTYLCPWSVANSPL